MALVSKFDLVYRDGAPTGSPVNSLKIFDSYADLGTGNIGDFGYAKDISILYLCKGGTSWYPIVTQEMNFPLTGDITIGKNIPTINLKWPGWSRYSVIQSLHPDSISMSSNYYWNGSDWVRPDTSTNALAVEIGGPGMSFTILGFPAWEGVRKTYIQTEAGANRTTINTSIILNNLLLVLGSITEYNRPLPQGTWTSIPYNSNDFWGGQAAWTVPSAELYSYTYCLIGKTCIFSFRVHATTVAANTYLHVRLPSGMTCKGYQYVTSITCADGLGWTQGLASTQEGHTYITIVKNLWEQFPPGALHIGFQLEFGIY